MTTDELHAALEACRKDASQRHANWQALGESVVKAQAEAARLRAALSGLMDIAGSSELWRNARAALAATSDEWLREKLSEARREQAQTDHEGMLDVLNGKMEMPMPSDVEKALAEHDARVRAQALDDSGLCLSDKCEAHCGYSALRGCEAIKAALAGEGKTT